MLTAATACATAPSVLRHGRQPSTKAPSERSVWRRNCISRVLPQTDDFIYKSHGVHFTLTFAEAITAAIQSFREFRAMAYVTCHLVADDAWSNTPMLSLDWAEQLISLVRIPKQIRSDYFETRVQEIVTEKKSTDVFMWKFDPKNTSLISWLLVGHRNSGL